MASLRELQHAFAAALRSPGAACEGVVGHFDVYRHNSEAVFRGVLEISFPVLHRRVGDDYFRQLAHHYRERHPSRSGDLQWVGQHFAAFLAEHLRDSEYAWLADLAALEWAREIASIVDPGPALEARRLGDFAPVDLERLRFQLQPGLTLLASPYPVFTVWISNQSDIAPPVDQSMGAEQGVIRPGNGGAVVQPIGPPEFSFLQALASGATLGDAVVVAGLGESELLRTLQLIFSANLVRDVSLAAPKSS